MSRPREIDRLIALQKAGAVLKELSPVTRKNTFRDAVRAYVGDDGGNLWRILYEIAQGRPWRATLEDGSFSAPQIPSTADRLEAAKYLANTLFGRPVDQTKVMAAEKAAQDQADLSYLSTHELVSEAKKYIHDLAVAGIAPVAPIE
jgi:hypothetical protein